MKRYALLVVFLALVAGACGGGGDSSADSLPEAPTAPASAGEELPPAPTAPESSMDAEAADEPAPAPAAPDGEEVGERRGIGTPSPAPAESEPTPAGGDAGPAAREEDTSRPKAPIISGQTLAGEAISIEDFLGTPVVVKVFAEH